MSTLNWIGKEAVIRHHRRCATNDQQFEELLESTQDMGRHMRGEAVAGIRVQEFPEPDVKSIRQRTELSQSRFADLIGVKPKTLQNWKQKPVRPTGSSLKLTSRASSTTTKLTGPRTLSPSHCTAVGRGSGAAAC